jgi:exodeoxyribonuclease VII large subunit
MTAFNDQTGAQAAADEQPQAPPVRSVSQTHRHLSMAIRNTLLDHIRIEACISGVRDNGTLWIEMTAILAGPKERRVIEARVHPRAREHLEEAAGAFGQQFVGATILVDLKLGLGDDFRIRAVIMNVVQVCPGPTQRAAQLALEKMREEGLAHQQRRLPAPDRIRNVAVICPFGSSAAADIEAVLGRLYGEWEVRIHWLWATFEGPNARASVIAALGQAAELAKAGQADAGLIGRGGGTPSARGHMDDEDIARAVARMPIPIISGVGHANNVCLVDEVAWMAAATPTDAAQEVRRLVARTIITQKPEAAAGPVPVANSLSPQLDAGGGDPDERGSSKEAGPNHGAAQPGEGGSLLSDPPAPAEAEPDMVITEIVATEARVASISRNVAIADAIDQLPPDLVARIRAGAYPRAFGSRG